MGMFLRCTVGSQAMRCDHFYIISSSQHFLEFVIYCSGCTWEPLGLTGESRWAALTASRTPNVSCLKYCLIQNDGKGLTEFPQFPHLGHGHTYKEARVSVFGSEIKARESTMLGKSSTH